MHPSFGNEGLACSGGQGSIRREGTSDAPQRQLDRRLEEVAKAIGGGYCRLQMPLTLALGVRDTVAGHKLGGLKGGGGGAGGECQISLERTGGGDCRDRHWGPAARVPHHIGRGAERRLMPCGSLMS